MWLLPRFLPILTPPPTSVIPFHAQSQSARHAKYETSHLLQIKLLPLVGPKSDKKWGVRPTGLGGKHDIPRPDTVTCRQARAAGIYEENFISLALISVNLCALNAAGKAHHFPLNTPLAFKVTC